LGISVARSSLSAQAFLAMITVGALAQGPPLQQNLIHVEITGMRNEKGQAVCALFSSASDFPKKAENAVARTNSEIRDRHAVCDFAGIAPGTYAVSVFHDENSNGKLDTNFMGIRREGVGASNNAKGHLGPPKVQHRHISLCRWPARFEDHHQLPVSLGHSRTGCAAERKGRRAPGLASLTHRFPCLPDPWLSLR
jgi:uncharacterized protein (DUF2141 family)